MSLDLPQEVREVIASRVSSIDQLDVLLHVFRAANPQKVEEVAQVLGIARETAGMRLFLLSSAGLLEAEGAPDVSYRTAKAAAPLSPLLELLAQAYQQDRSAVSQWLFGNPADPVKSFADAFRLKK